MNSIISIVTLQEEYYKLAKCKLKNVYNTPIQNYIPKRETVLYVSPANSLGFMDGGIDKVYMMMFDNVEKIVKSEIEIKGKFNLIGQKYLPIGSSIIAKVKTETELKLKDKKCYIVSSPTMLFPQDVKDTRNCYYATMATLYNIFINCKFTNCEVVFTSMCCGYGKMTSEESFKQFLKAIDDFENYKPETIYENCIIHEPNLDEQPNFYENTAFKNIKSEEIITS